MHGVMTPITELAGNATKAPLLLVHIKDVMRKPMLHSQASAELLSRMTQQIRDAAKGDDDAESAMQAAAAAQREAERQELERLRAQQQAQQRRQQQQQEDAVGGLDAGAVQRARERRARAAAQALQQLQEAEQEREGSARAVSAANPFALSNEERAKWEADEHLYNDPKASKRGKQAAQQIISSSGSSTPSTNSSTTPSSASDSRPAEHGANDSQGDSPAAGRSGRSSPSGLEPRQGTRGTPNPAGAPSAVRAGSPVEPAAAVPAAAGALALTDEQRQEWGDWHEELGGIRGSAAGRRRRQQQQPNGHTDHTALATAVAIPEPPELLPARLEVPLRPAMVQTQQRHSQQQGRGGAAWQQPLVQLIELLDEAGKLVARSIGASISASLRGSSSSSNSGASRLRASSAQHAPERSAAAAREIRHAAGGERGMGLSVEAAAETQEARSLRQMREVAQELADEVVGASSLARGVAARDMDSVAAPAPVLPASMSQHGLASAPAGAAVDADAGGYEMVEHAAAAAAAGEEVASVVQQRQRKVEAARADVNPFLMPAAAMLEYEEDEGAEREAEVARMQVVLPPVRAAFVQQRGA